MWEESKHPRDDDGRFTAKNGTPAEHKRLREKGIISEEEKRLNNKVKSKSIKAETSYTITATKAEMKKFDSNYNNILGKEFKGYKGQNAINKLLQERHGHIKGAFNRKDIGDIDLVWGNKFLGLQHIIERRNNENINLKEFLNDLTNVIEQGVFKRKNEKGNFEFIYNGKIAVVSPELQNHKITFLLTAFKTRQKK